MDSFSDLGIQKSVKKTTNEAMEGGAYQSPICPHKVSETGAISENSFSGNHEASVIKQSDTLWTNQESFWDRW